MDGVCSYIFFLFTITATVALYQYLETGESVIAAVALFFALIGIGMLLHGIAEVIKLKRF